MTTVAEECQLIFYNYEKLEKAEIQTVAEECQLIFYNYKKLEKAEIQRVENKEGGKRKKK